jgi:hypothetical protein
VADVPSEFSAIPPQEINKSLTQELLILCCHEFHIFIVGAILEDETSGYKFNTLSSYSLHCKETLVFKMSAYVKLSSA